VFSRIVARAVTRAAASTNQKIVVNPPPFTRAAESAARLSGLEVGVQRSAYSLRISVQHSGRRLKFDAALAWCWDQTCKLTGHSTRQCALVVTPTLTMGRRLIFNQNVFISATGATHDLDGRFRILINANVLIAGALLGR